MKTVKPKCQAAVWVRDTYRYTGRGRSGFEMHYTERRCNRSAVDGKDFCWQHEAEIERRGKDPLRFDCKRVW